MIGKKKQDKAEILAAWKKSIMKPTTEYVIQQLEDAPILIYKKDVSESEFEFRLSQHSKVAELLYEFKDSLQKQPDDTFYDNLSSCIGKFITAYNAELCLLKTGKSKQVLKRLLKEIRKFIKSYKRFVKKINDVQSDYVINFPIMNNNLFAKSEMLGDLYMDLIINEHLFSSIIDKAGQAGRPIELSKSVLAFNVGLILLDYGFKPTTYYDGLFCKLLNFCFECVPVSGNSQEYAQEICPILDKIVQSVSENYFETNSIPQ